MIILGLSSCSDEIEQIDTEIEFPESAELITGNLTGDVTKWLPQGSLDVLTVDILVDGVVIASTQAVDDTYSFTDQPMHPTRTVVRAYSSTLSATYQRLAIEEGETVVLDLAVGQFSAISERSTAAFTLENGQGFSAAFADDYLSESVQLGYRFYQFPSDEILMPLMTGIDADGNFVELNFDRAYYIGAYEADSEALLNKADKAFTVTIPDALGEDVWVFDISTGLWNQSTAFVEVDKAVQLESEHFTYFATEGEFVVSTGCAPDIEAPIALCNTNYDLDLSVSNSINSSEIDNGSSDNCDDELRILILKETDVCNANPGASYQNFFCNEETGEVINCTLLAMDDAGNVSECAYTVTVTGEIDCPGDMTKPIPFCLSSLSVVLQNGSATLQAEAIDIGSFDNCTRTLDFQVKKERDACINGSEVYAPQIEFCQNEFSTEVIVEMLVTDSNGNSDFCRTNVSVTE